MRTVLGTQLGVALALLLLVGCGGGSGGNDKGTLTIAATDAPFPVNNACLSAVEVTVSGISVQRTGNDPSGGSGFVSVPLPNGPVTIDLLDLRNGVSAQLATSELPVGTYHQIRLVLTGSRLVFADQSTRPFTVPSGQQSGIKINVSPPFTIATSTATTVMMDFDLARSFRMTGGGNQEPTCDNLKNANNVLFRPTVRAFNPEVYGVILGHVVDVSTPVANIEVSAYAAGDTPGTDDPIAVTFSSPSGLSGTSEGDYALSVPAGTYDLYYRAAGDTNFTPAPIDGGTGAHEDVVVTSGQETAADIDID